jgi:predicted NBD/HSP70 family sugar kinase
MYLAIDIGGTKTLVATLDADGTIQQRLKFPTAKEYPDFIRTLADTVAYLSTKEFTAVGVGAPGLVDHKNGIVIALGNLPWRNVHLQEDISRICHAPCIIENDAKAAGLSEAMLVKEQYNKVLYLIIGTGIGGSVIFNQRLDPLLLNTEPGQMLLEYNGKLQRWEDFASGRAITERFGKRASEITDEKDWKEIAHNLALGIIDLLAVIRPDVVVLGGGVVEQFEHFEKYLVGELKSYETPMVTVPPILKGQRPEEAVLYGCYELAKSLHETTHP